MKCRVVDLFLAECYTFTGSCIFLFGLLDFLLTSLLARWSWMEILRYLLILRTLSCMREWLVLITSFSPILLSARSEAILRAICCSSISLVSGRISFWICFTFSSYSMKSSTSSLSDEEDEEDEGGRRPFLSPATIFCVSGAMIAWEFSDKSMLSAKWFWCCVSFMRLVVWESF